MTDLKNKVHIGMDVAGGNDQTVVCVAVETDYNADGSEDGRDDYHHSTHMEPTPEPEEE